MLLSASVGEKRRENLHSLQRHITQVKGKLGLPSFFNSNKAMSSREIPFLALPCSELCLRSVPGGGAG